MKFNKRLTDKDDIESRVTRLEVGLTDLAQSVEKFSESVKEDLSAIEALITKITDNQKPDWQVWLTAMGLILLVVGLCFFPVKQQDDFLDYKINELKEKVEKMEKYSHDKSKI